MASQTKHLDHLRAVLRRNHYSRRTEQNYVAWVRRDAGQNLLVDQINYPRS